jgi:hypothetical protein
MRLSLHAPLCLCLLTPPPQSITPADRPAKTEPSDSRKSAQPETMPQLDLPSVRELPEPGTATPQKPAMEPASKLPQSSNAQTPLKSKSSQSLQVPAGTSTPKNRTPIRPGGGEMHPALHHASTAKVLDEARWLGFQALGAHTAPPKAFGAGPGTPSKTPIPASSKVPGIESSPDSFRFRFKSPFAQTPKRGDVTLSPATRDILKEPSIGATPGGSRLLFNATEFSSKADVTPQRQMAEPKGKMARFSDVHMAQFKKMDSIANHPSAFRADPTRFKPVGQPLKKSPSKPDLAKPESNKLKRTQSKMDVAEGSAGSSKRAQSTADSSSKVPPTPLKRTQSKIDTKASSLPRAQSTTRPAPSADAPAPKRVKRTEADDAATTRPASRDNKPAAAPTPARKVTSQTALPRFAARLMTPTKSSIARSQSVKVSKTSSLVPSMPRSPSVNHLLSPSAVGQSVRDGARESMRKASQSLQRVRSILRTPGRKFSDDPVKIAAGTHMSPPPMADFDEPLPPMPATAPAKKHVNFSSSTFSRTAMNELGKSPSPMKFKGGSEIPEGAVIYPTLKLAAERSTLPGDGNSPSTSPSRRLEFGGEVVSNPRQFSFESGRPINFGKQSTLFTCSTSNHLSGPTSTGSIRMVRPSDATAATESTKRRLGNIEEVSDKENSQPAEFRSAKKMRPTPATPSKTPASASKLPRRTPNRGSAISKSRLNFLATPKRGKA